MIYLYQKSDAKAEVKKPTTAHYHILCLYGAVLSSRSVAIAAHRLSAFLLNYLL